MAHEDGLAKSLCRGAVALAFIAAADVNAVQLRAGLSWMDFSYKEFDDGGEILDREDGSLPGLGIGLNQPFGRWTVDAELTYHAGRVEYRGQTQPIRVSHTTDTDETIWDGAVYVSYAVAEQPLRLLGGLGYRFWERDIQPAYNEDLGYTVPGLLEYYYWYYLTLGAQIYVTEDFSVDARALRPVDATMELAVNGSNSKFDMGERWGLRLATPWRTVVSPSLVVILEPYLQYWQFDASSLVYVPGLGGFAYEPDNETLTWGLRAWFATDL